MKKYASEYLRRLIGKFLAYLTGGIVASVIYGLTYIFPSIQVPNWFYTSILPLLSFLFANYSVFSENKAREAELLEEIHKLKQDLQNLQNCRPIIEVGFLEGSTPVKKIHRNLKPIPPEPDYDRLLEGERKRIHDKLRRGPFPARKINPWFPKRVERPYVLDEAIQEVVTRYITDYRWYLNHEYRYSIFQDRCIRLQPLVENKGGGESSNVRVDFYIPLGYSKNRKDKEWMEVEFFGISKPKKPAEPTIESIHKKYSSDNSETGFNIPPPDNSHTADNNWTAGNPRCAIDWLEDVTRISYFFNCLVPGQTEEDLDPISLWLGEVEGNQKIEIRVVVIGSNIIDGPKEDMLEIEFIALPVKEGSEAEIKPPGS